jgi:hypothetical protein
MGEIVEFPVLDTDGATLTILILRHVREHCGLKEAVDLAEQMAIASLAVVEKERGQGRALQLGTLGRV